VVVAQTPANAVIARCDSIRFVAIAKNRVAVVATVERVVVGAAEKGIRAGATQNYIVPGVAENRVGVIVSN